MPWKSVGRLGVGCWLICSSCKNGDDSGYTTSVWEFPPASSVVPPPAAPALTLKSDCSDCPLETGEISWFHVAGAEPGDVVRLFVSMRAFDTGVCPTPLGGKCLVLDAPIEQHLTMEANARGEAPFRVKLQRDHEAVEVYLQAAVIQGGDSILSNPLTEVLNPGRPEPSGITVHDVGPQTRFQADGAYLFQRARTLLAADYDLDGRTDFYLGNPGDDSVVLRNVADGTSVGYRFEHVQTLLSGSYAWAGATADYDNDGDYDIFVAAGGNECASFNYLFRNMVVETGSLWFQDVTSTAGVGGVDPTGSAGPMPQGGAGAVWGDIDRDGDVDLFVSGNSQMECGKIPTRNALFQNNGDRTFTDITHSVGLAFLGSVTRHSTLLDFDNDGDLDLYENNLDDANRLWRNELVETGSVTFTDVTDAQSDFPNSRLSDPNTSFASCAGDFNNDGWEDIIAFARKGADCHDGPPGTPEGPGEVNGHALFLNEGGTRFLERGDEAGINHLFENDQGVMGCQIGDLDNDGILDVFMGNGGAPTGQANQLFLSKGVDRYGVPVYENASGHIDFPSAAVPGLPVLPPYPYRTHGTAMVDIDGNGSLELAVSNGGPASSPDVVREPNRLFHFAFDDPHESFSVRPVGDGVHVSTDAIGTRMRLTISRGGVSTYLHRTLYGGSCFSAQNGFDVHFGLGAADAIEELQVVWPDGHVEVLTEGLIPGNRIIVSR